MSLKKKVKERKEINNFPNIMCTDTGNLIHTVSVKNSDFFLFAAKIRKTQKVKD